MKIYPIVICLAVLLFAISLAAQEPDLTAAMNAFSSEDYERAVKMLLPLAESGDKTACMKLGEMFERGLGTPKNRTVALAWYFRAKQLGNTDVNAAISRLQDQLSPESVQKARVLASHRSFDFRSTSGCLSAFGDKIDLSKVASFRPDASVDQMVADIVNYSGLKKNFEVRQVDVGNAAAVIYPPQSTNRYLLYNPNFRAEVDAKTGSQWAFYSIMAHEIAHHLQGHTLDNAGSRPARELEADEWSGFILYMMNATLPDALVAMESFASDFDGPTHPAKAKRIDAIRSGYEKGRRLHPRTTQQSMVTRRTTTAGEPEPAPAPVKRKTINPPPPRVASVCQTSFSSCPMAVALPQGSYCVCYTMWGDYPGIAY